MQLKIAIRNYLKTWVERLRQQHIRGETVTLLVGFVATVLGKITALGLITGQVRFLGAFFILIPDILFFVAVYLLTYFLYLLRPSITTSRICLLLTGLVTFWAVLNGVWLADSGVQLQSGIVLVFVRDFVHLWPLAQSHLLASLKHLFFIIAGLSITAGCFLWWFIYPAPLSRNRGFYIRRIVLSAGVVMILLLIRPTFAANCQSVLSNEVLGFSSHFQAVASVVRDIHDRLDGTAGTRDIPLSGQRVVTAPGKTLQPAPNVVIVILESVSEDAYTTHPECMPFLHQIAGEGVLFSHTRAVMSHTTKAAWAMLTGSTPVVGPDYIEALPVRRPYESLVTILQRQGYRSAFFQMSKGSFECAPGLCSNLGFDWAWFRENLEDPSADLGYMAGDDCRMLEPAFEWIGTEDKPFCLVMASSVSHDPYDVPASFEQPKLQLAEKYLQSLRYTDYFLRQLYQNLQHKGLAEDTILCIIGDHGTSPESTRNAARWRPLEEVIRVPWIIHWPGRIHPNSHFDWPCSQMDVTPTILKLMGFGIEQAAFEGRDAFSPSPCDRRLYFSSWYKDSPIGFVEGDMKIVYWPYSDRAFEYNLATDPGEQNPTELAPQAVEPVKNKILRWQNSSQIFIDPRRHTRQVLYRHWLTISSGHKADASYLHQPAD